MAQVAENMGLTHWRAIVAMVVALLLGGGVGALAEHQRAVGSSNSKSPKTSSATKKPTSSTKFVAAPDWFGTKKSTACPSLKKWLEGARGAYTALVKKAAWDVKKAGILKSYETSDAAYRALIPLANAKGEPELRFALGALDASRDRLKASKAGAALPQVPKSASTERLVRDRQALTKMAKSCTAA